MIDPNAVYTRLCDIITLDAQGAASCLPLCIEAAGEISSKLCNSSFDEDPAVIYAAAATAYYRYMLFKCAQDDGVTAFKAGDVSVTKSAGYVMDTAQKIKQDALISAARYFTDDDFVFRQVGI